MFLSRPTVSPGWRFHEREDHDNIVANVRKIMDRCGDIAIEGLIAMPTSTYWQLEPVTDEQYKARPAG